MDGDIETPMLAKGTAWSFFSKAGAKLVSFVYLVLVARLFPQEQIGIFYFVAGLIGMVTVFGDLGFSASLVRYVPFLYGKKQIAKLRKLIKFAYVFGGGLAVLFSAVLFISAGFVSSLLGRPEIKPVLEILSLLLLMYEITGVSNGVLIGRKRIKESESVLVLQNTLKLILTVIFAFFIGATAVSLSYGYILSFIIPILVLFHFVRKEMKRWIKDVEPCKEGYFAIGGEVLSFGIILSLLATFSMIANSTDRVMLGILGGESAFEDVGVYSIAVTFSEILRIFPLSIATIFFPMVSELFGRGEKEGIRKITSVAVKWLIIITAPIAVLMIVFPDSILSMFYGSEYARGGPSMAVYLSGLFVLSLSFIPLRVIAAMRRLDIELKIAALAAVLNVVLNFLFIPIWGISGAATATAISFLFMTFLSFFYSKKLFDFSFPKGAYKPLLAAVVAFLILYLSRQNILSIVSLVPVGELAMMGGLAEELAQKLIKLVIFGILFLLATAVYFGLLIISRSFGKEELYILERALVRAKVPEKYVGRIVSFFGG